MNFFEQEMKKIMGKSSVLKDQKYAGRKCYGTIDGDLRGCVEFVTLGISNQYAGIKTSIINRKEGLVDSMMLRFSDLFGKKRVSNQNFKEGIVPHIWENGMDKEWYVYHPTEMDYESMRENLDNYLGIFQEQAMVQEEGMQQRL